MPALGWFALASVLLVISGRWIVLIFAFMISAIILGIVAISSPVVPERRNFGKSRRASSS